MKNLAYIPFKKNRYFTGKLLTAGDFDQEQQYFDNKRRLINRWMLGTGIVAGLEVIRVDDYSISVEMGLALDFTGREIMVEMPVIRKLSLLDGYEDATAQEGAESLYLYIEYDCTEMEPVHNITNRSVHTVEEETFNKYREGYHLYVSDEEPIAGEPPENPDTLRQIYHRAEYISQGTYRRGICLAKIELVKAGDFYMIETIIPPEQSQWVYAQPVTMGLLRDLQSQLMRWKASGKEDAEAPAQGQAEVLPEPFNEAAEAEWQFAQGRISISIPPGSKPGHCLYSSEIAHGLGLGEVELILHVHQGGYCYSGSEGIFPEAEKTVEAAARLDMNMGTFVIGIRLLEVVSEEDVWVGWTAVRKRSRNEFKRAEPRIYIQPGVVNLKTRESVLLKAVCVNMHEKDLVWQVRSEGSGSIDPDGTYHAPNHPGVYEVTCVSRWEERVRAVVYVVVRE